MQLLVVIMMFLYTDKDPQVLISKCTQLNEQLKPIIAKYSNHK